MNKYYSLETLIEAKRGSFCDMYDLEDFLGEIPEEKILKITRCKDCKYYDNEQCYHRRHDHHGQSVYQEADDFCNYAEQKEFEGE